MIDGFILAGGASSRMGADKSRLQLGGKSLLSRAVATMSAITDSVGVVGIGDCHDIQVDDGVRFIPDNQFDNCGPVDRAPIFGLLTALSCATAEWSAVLAVDLPFVTVEFLLFISAFITSEVDAVIPRQPDNRLQPLCAFYRTSSCLPVAGRLVEAGQLSLHQLAKNLNSRIVTIEDFNHLHNSNKFFVNINTVGDLDHARSLIHP